MIQRIIKLRFVFVLFLSSNSWGWGEFASGVSYNTVYDQNRSKHLSGPRSESIGVDANLKLGAKLSYLIVGAASSTRWFLEDSTNRQDLGSPTGFQILPISPLVALDFPKIRFEGQYIFLGSYKLDTGTRYSSPKGGKLTITKSDLGKFQNKIPFRGALYAEYIEYKKSTSQIKAKVMSTGVQIGFDY